MREFILGQAQAWLSPLECGLLSAAGLGALIVIVRGWRSSKALRSAGVLLTGYLALAVGLRLIPLNTGVHHWVMGSPFQYAALALAAGELLSQPRAQAGQLTRRLTGVGLGVFLLFRLTSLTLTEVSLARGDSSIVWDPSLTTAAQFAAEHRADSLFISANWGTANQILCFANGDADAVIQTGWNLDNLEGLRSLFKESDRDTVYIYFRISGDVPLSANHQAVLDELLESLQGEWQQRPLDPELQGLKAVRVVQLVRIAAHE